MSDLRRDTLAAMEAAGVFDLLVVGGGANGAGIALDAASRGLRVALCEQGEFGGGTSSRSSKLIHGGVRYVGLGQWRLVREALRERALLLQNAPALVQPLSFLVPAYSGFEWCKFGFGLWLYDRLAGGYRLRASRSVDAQRALAAAPHLRAPGLRGATCYQDAGFDDARLLLALLARARALGALTLNHARVTALTQGAGGRIDGAVVRDALNDRELTVRARVVVNAAGPYGDAVRRLQPGVTQATISPSQGAHIVVPGHFLGGGKAVVFPHTPDGRIMFAIPWHGRLLLGTTDTPMTTPPARPRPLADEIDQILGVAGRYLDPAPTRQDILASFAGLRPLAGRPDGAATARRSREHLLDVSPAGLLTVSGGKWTTYRLIAEQAVDLAASVASLAAAPSPTRALAIAPLAPLDEMPAAEPFADYGADAAGLAALVADAPALGEPLHPALPYTGAHYLWATRHEMARRVADALAIHTRVLFLDVGAALQMAPAVAAIMAAELGESAGWIGEQIDRVKRVAQDFLPP